MSWNTRFEPHVLGIALQAEQSFDAQTIHPTTRTSIPTPTTATDMRWRAINIRRNDIRFYLIMRSLIRGIRAADRVDHLKEAVCQVAVTSLRPRPNAPQGRVCVLSTILAHTRQISLDISRITTRLIKGRCKEQD